MTNSILKIHFLYRTTVPLTISVNQKQVSYDVGISLAEINYLPNYSQKNTLKIFTDSDKITQECVTIKKLEFEDFWKISGNKISMMPITDDLGVEKQPNHNTLFFKGALIFNFKHPLYMNFLGHYQ